MNPETQNKKNEVAAGGAAPEKYFLYLEQKSLGADRLIRPPVLWSFEGQIRKQLPVGGRYTSLTSFVRICHLKEGELSCVLTAVISENLRKRRKRRGATNTLCASWNISRGLAQLRKRT